MLSGLQRGWPLLVVATLVTLGFRFGWRRGLRARPVWLGALVVAALPPLLVAMTWARVLPEAYLRFGRPALTPIGFVVVLLAGLRCVAGGHRMTPRRRRLMDAATALAVLACGLSIASPELGIPLDRLTVVAVLDRSRSIDLVPSAEERVRRELAVAEGSMREDDRLGRVVFAGEAASEERPRPRRAPSSPQRVEVGREATDLAAGLRRALAELPADSAARLVVLSDGVATRGDAMAAAAAAAASRIPVDVVVLEQRAMKDVRLVALRAPSSSSDAESLRLRAVVAAPEATDVELRVLRDGVLVRRAKARVEPGENVLALVEPSPGSGLHRYDVEVTALDPRLDESADDNARTTFVRVRGPARALVLDGDPGKTAFVAGALRGAKLSVEEGSVSSFPADVAAMAAYDVIVVGDIPAHAIAPAQIDALAAYVRDLGGGLFLLGGDRSFGPGGYARSVLEEVSPVSFDLKQDRRRGSLAEVIAIDISGSMAASVGALTKLDLANEAAARSAALLGAGDLLGVDHVDTESHWTVPLAPVTDPAAVDAAIRKAGPGGGGILVDVALRDAYAALGKATVNLKHVLLFADGSDAENITPVVKSAVERAASAGITTSVVALGEGHDVPDCEDLSRLGQGRFYIVENAERLPAVFTQETILASRAAVIDRAFRVARGPNHPALDGVDVAAAPELGGYVVTIAKPRANVPLTGPESDPVLAEWQVGLGHTAAFTSDLKDRWGSAWTEWPGAARLAAQVARHVARREDDRRVRLEAEVVSGQLELRATVVDDDGRLSTFRRLEALVRGPRGFSRRIALEAAGAGSYRAALPLESPGAYVATAVDALDGAAVATAGAALGLGDELRPTGSDAAALARIAELTSGKRRDTLAGIFADRGPRRFTYEDVTTELLALAAFAWLLAVAARRLSILDEPLFASRAGATADVRSPSDAPRVEAVQADATLAALMSKRNEARAAAPSPGEPALPLAPPPAASLPRVPPSRGAPSTGTPLPFEPLPSRSSETRTAPQHARAATQQRRAESPQEPTLEAASTSAGEPAPGPSATTVSATDERGRALTAAEILLARRKRRQ
ncbi:MAG: VWA domain-containing protein [Deltaproteobacteria bacterium]|nr:VWA domain-containing protein [Deltaproteobacteria bacterium]